MIGTGDTVQQRGEWSHWLRMCSWETENKKEASTELKTHALLKLGSKSVTGKCGLKLDKNVNFFEGTFDG